jgi:ATP-binding protein involved in chromosome partitioning
MPPNDPRNGYSVRVARVSPPRMTFAESGFPASGMRPKMVRFRRIRFADGCPHDPHDRGTPTVTTASTAVPGNPANPAVPGAPLTEPQVLAALSGVTDPELGRDVVSLQYVRKVRVCDGVVSVDLESAVPTPASHAALRDRAAAALKGLPGVTDVTVNVRGSVRRANANPAVLTGVKNVVAVASGKGGVGKSTVAANLACALKATGASVGMLDCDIYGPSQPMMFGAVEPPMQDGRGMIHPVVRHGIALMSMGLVANERTPVIWRGPMVHNMIRTFLTQVEWGELDYLVLDLPPGTGDAQLSLSQNAPLSGAVIVTTPQDVSLIDARKGLRMFREVKVPVLGVVENMSHFACENCGHRHEIFRHGGAARLCSEAGVPLLGEVPLDPEVVVGGDEGTPVLLRKPDSPAAKAFADIAARVAARLAELSLQTAEIPGLTL